SGRPLSMNALNLLKKSSPILFAVFISLTGCKKETEKFEAVTPSDYLPLQTGKYITYRTDSTLFTSFGTVTTVRSYQEKHIVDALINDNEGRPSYRILRFVRDTAGAGPWQPSGSYFITPDTTGIEL